MCWPAVRLTLPEDARQVYEVGRGKLIVGRISGFFGLLGWVKVVTYTQPRENILRYNPWYLWLDRDWCEVKLIAGRKHGNTVVANLEGFETREHAASLLGVDVAIEQDQLIPLPEGEFYWAQLIGLRAVNLRGSKLGVVDRLMETNANDVLVIKGKREILVPFVHGSVVKAIDLDAGYIQVDWDLDY